MKIKHEYDLFQEDRLFPVAILIVTKNIDENNEDDMNLFRFIRQHPRNRNLYFIKQWNLDRHFDAHVIITMVNFKDELMCCDRDDFKMLMDMYCQNDIEEWQAHVLHNLLNADGIELKIGEWR